MSGLSDKITGQAKQAAGTLTNDDKLKNEGKIDEAKGTIKEKLDEAVENVTEKVDEVKKKLEK